MTEHEDMARQDMRTSRIGEEVGCRDTKKTLLQSDEVSVSLKLNKKDCHLYIKDVWACWLAQWNWDLPRSVGKVRRSSSLTSKCW